MPRHRAHYWPDHVTGVWIRSTDRRRNGTAARPRGVHAVEVGGRRRITVSSRKVAT